MKQKTKFKQTEIGLIPEDWEVVNLNRIANITMGQSPPSNTYNYDKKGLPFFQGRKDFGSKYPKVTVWCAEPKRIADKDEILLSVRAPIGDINVAKEECCIGRGLSALSMKNKNNEFLFYLLNFNRKRLESTFEGEGTVFGCVTKDGLSDFIVAYTPRRKEQSRISKILSSLDSKIELNQQTNKTLEAICQALFRRWFVDFEFPNEEGKPYRSSDGEMVDSELGKVPRGWRVGTIGEGFNLTMGQSPPGETYNEVGDGLPFFQGRSDFGFRYPTWRVFCSAPKRLANPGDTLVSVRAPVGDINMVLERCCIGRGVAAVRHKSGSRSYTYYVMRSLTDIFRDFEAEGTVFGCINKNDFQDIKYVAPHSQLVKKFEEIVFSIDQGIENNILQSRTLAALRDSLLPKLMSGRIRVNAGGEIK